MVMVLQIKPQFNRTMHEPNMSKGKFKAKGESATKDCNKLHMFRYKKAKETSIRKYRYNKCVYIRAQTLKMVNKRICKEIQECAWQLWSG